MNFIEVFAFYKERTSIAFVSTNTFLGDTQTLLQQKRENKLYSVLAHRVIFSLCESVITPFGRSVILFAFKTCEANNTRR